MQSRDKEEEHSARVMTREMDGECHKEADDVAFCRNSSLHLGILTPAILSVFPLICF